MPRQIEQQKVVDRAMMHGENLTPDLVHADDRLLELARTPVAVREAGVARALLDLAAAAAAVVVVVVVVVVAVAVAFAAALLFPGSLAPAAARVRPACLSPCLHP